MKKIVIWTSEWNLDMSPVLSLKMADEWNLDMLPVLSSKMVVSARKVRINIVKFSGFNKESNMLLNFLRKNIFSVHCKQ